jgi:hypothetical protein
MAIKAKTLLLRGGLAALMVGTLSEPGLADPVGAASEVQDTAFRMQPEQAPDNLAVADPVLLYDTVETPDEALARLLFLDESTVTIGPNADLYIDEFVYDPSSGISQVIGQVGSGAFRFVSGTSRHENSVITTPTATLGIRGTSFFVNVLPDGSTLTVTDDGEVFAQAILQTGRQVSVPAGTFALIQPDDDQIITGDQMFMNAALEHVGLDPAVVIDQRVYALSSATYDRSLLTQICDNAGSSSSTGACGALPAIPIDRLCPAGTDCEDATRQLPALEPAAGPPPQQPTPPAPQNDPPPELDPPPEPAPPPAPEPPPPEPDPPPPEPAPPPAPEPPPEADPPAESTAPGRSGETPSPAGNPGNGRAGDESFQPGESPVFSGDGGMPGNANPPGQQ